MSAETEFETWVRAELAVIAEPVTPRPDPYGRLTRRRRMGWLRGGVIAGVAALATGTAVAVSPAGSPPTPPPDGALGWTDALVYGPPRGALAVDETFRTDMTAAVAAIVRDGADHPDLRSLFGRGSHEQEVRLLFADDIDDQRIVVLALRHPTLVGAFGRTSVAWAVGPRGSTAGALASAFTASPLPGVLSGHVYGAPFTVVLAGVPSPDTAMPDDPPPVITTIGLAPTECAISTAPPEDLTDWTPEPTGSYIIRTEATYRPEQWRVTCDGVVRDEHPAPWQWTAVEFPDEMLEPLQADLAAAGLDGGVIDNIPRAMNYDMAFNFGPYIIGPPRALYVTEELTLTDGGTPEPHSAAVVVAPTVYSTWVGFVSLWRNDIPDSFLGSRTTGYFRLDMDPFAPGATAAFALGAPGEVVALLTPAAAAAELVAPDGTVLARSTVVDRAAVLASPDSYRTPDGVRRVALEGLRIVAYDAAGTLISTTPLAKIGIVDETRNWD